MMAQVRITAFSVMLVALGPWEVAAPRQALSASKPIRWFSNITLLVINSLALRFGLAV